MSKVCVVTGGGSGMGLEVAKLIGDDAIVVISGRSVERLEGAIEELAKCGVDARPFACDVSNRASVDALVEFAVSLGDVVKVVHAAGVSPHMSDPAGIFAINAGGTVNVNEAFGPIVAKGGAILNVASMGAYMLPCEQAQSLEQLYALSLQDAAAFVAALGSTIEGVPEAFADGAAYTITKNFAVWYTKRQALKLGPRGVRVVSVSPGLVMTKMGEMEGDDGMQIAKAGALGRAAAPEELAKVMAFMLSDDASYLTGTDVLVDGGSVAAMQMPAK